MTFCKFDNNIKNQLKQIIGLKNVFNVNEFRQICYFRNFKIKYLDI